MICLCRKWSTQICGALSLGEERRQVIEYGLLALVQMTIILAGAMLAGAVFHFLLETVLLFFAVGILRKNTGGAHSDTIGGCTVMSIAVICTLAALCRYVLMGVSSQILAVFLLALCYGLAFLLVYRRAPMDTPNKPITKPEKINRLRRQSFFVLGFYAILSLALLLWGSRRGTSLSFAVSCASLWQAATLTRPGATMIRTVDRLFARSGK